MPDDAANRPPDGTPDGTPDAAPESTAAPAHDPIPHELPPELPRVGDARATSVGPPPLPLQGVNDRGVVVDEVTCRGCGYGLRGLSMDAVCPECQWPIVRSVMGTMLINSAPAHILHLKRGMGVAIAASFAAFASAFVGAGAGVLAAIPIASGPILTEAAANVITIGLATLSTLAGLLGWWMVSTPDPALADADRAGRVRRTLRALIVVTCALSLVNFVLNALFVAGILPPGPQWSPFSGSGGPGGPAMPAFGLTQTLLVVLGMFISLIGTAQTSLSMKYLATIVARVPDPSQQSFASTMVWLTWVLYFTGFLSCGLTNLALVVLYLIVLFRAYFSLSKIRAHQLAAPNLPVGAHG